MEYKEYHEQENQEIRADLAKMQSGFIPEDIFKSAHASVPLVCHDCLIEQEGKLLLVRRRGKPMQGILAPIGGRIQRGVPIEESLKEKVKAEAGLDIEEIVFIGITRNFWAESPFGNPEGLDAFNVMFFAQGKGKVKLDDLHADPVWIGPEEYTPEFKRTLHPYIKDYLDGVIPLIGKATKQKKETIPLKREIYSKINPSQLLHVIFRYVSKEAAELVKNEITPHSTFLQGMCYEISAGKYFKAHKHNSQDRPTSTTHEAFLIFKGEIELSIYDLDNKKLETVILREGDVSVIIAGAHSFTTRKPTVLYEFKNGPYYGPEKDKSYIE